MLADLHLHSTFSDGVYTPLELLCCAERQGLHTIAITDHDSLNGYVESLKVRQQVSNPPEVIAGLELGTQLEAVSIHILGYHVDHTNKLLLNKIQELRLGRETRLQKIIDKLLDLGYQVQVPGGSSANRAMGRPHVAKALVAQGYFPDIQAAFDTLLKRGAPAYVPQPKLAPQEAIALIHQAGGIACLAHPSELANQQLVTKLIHNYVFDGIEVWHPSANKAEVHNWLTLARQEHLVTAGGSDLHGPGRYPEHLGQFKVLYENVQSVIEYKQI
ncbi:MAG: PHP domain-containing protein [Acidaminococcaceae bacterium]